MVHGDSRLAKQNRKDRSRFASAWIAGSSPAMTALSFKNGRKQEREAERRQTLAPTCRAAGTAACCSQHARLSAFHHGSDLRAFARCARLQARFPGTWRERRSVTILLPEAASGAVDAGVTRPRLSQSSGSTPPAGRNAGLHDARSRPGAACVGPPAGTALAPHNREHPPRWRPLQSEIRNHI